MSEFQTTEVTIVLEDKLPTISVLDKIMFIEEFLLTLDQAEIPCTHNFANGIYVRQMTAPKNCVITGEIHKDEHIIMMSKGDCFVLSTDGKETVRYTGSNVIVIPPGIKRLFFIHEETIWATIHSVKETDLKKVEEEIFDRTYKLTDEKRNILKQTPLLKDMFELKKDELWLE